MEFMVNAIELSTDRASTAFPFPIFLTKAWGTAFGPITFEVYQGRKIRFFESGEAKFVDAYADFRRCLFEERKRQRRQFWDSSW
jgi:hypothetical protein